MTTTTRTLNRRQHAVYVSGSKAKGEYVYSLQVTERRNGVHLDCYEISGDAKPTRDEAIKSAWDSAKSWIAEVGTPAVTDTEISATAIDGND